MFIYLFNVTTGVYIYIVHESTPPASWIKYILFMKVLPQRPGVYIFFMKVLPQCPVVYIYFS